MEILTKQEPWDAIIIGSGATGGVASRQLTAAGMRVLVLEAGGKGQGRSHHGSFVSNGVRQLYRHFVSHRQQIQKAHPTYWTTNPDFFVDDIKNPYTTPEDKPFRWIRGRCLGGRSVTWDAVAPRFSDFEFKAASRDGYGPDWPICHADLAPYYSELEKFLGVHGSRDGLEQLPDGNYLDPRPMTPAEKIFKEKVEKTFGDRKVIISRGLQARRRPDKDQKHSMISSPATTLNAAEKTGRLEVRTNAVVSRILTSADGTTATGVEFIDAHTHRVEEVRAKIVFLCASTIESLRILMNSKNNAHPEGIGASSGVLGRYIMDHSAGNIYFYMPDVKDDGGGYELLGSDSIMIPRYQNLGNKRESHLRGFGIWGGIQRLPVPAFLRKKKDLAFGFLCARSETLPHYENYVALDPLVKDAWGIPAAHISCEWKAPDMAIARSGRQAAMEIVQAAGGKVADLTEIFHTPFVSGHIQSMQKEWTLSTPGMFVHEVGGARMGTHPQNSVVDQYCRVWDTQNIFVTDGACWPTSGWQNPTLTEMAITARACDQAIADLKAKSGI
jgi:choline dehydrogenase-like flavoprotein